MTDLKPCPFCENDVILHGSDYVWWIECDGCGLHNDLASNQEKSIVDWNTRPLEDAVYKKGYDEAYEYNEVIAELMDKEFNEGVEAEQKRIIEAIQDKMEPETYYSDGWYIPDGNAIVRNEAREQDIAIAEGVKK